MKDTLESSLEEYQEALESLVNAESQFKALDDITKRVLAQNFGNVGTVKEKENKALTSDLYGKHLELLAEARTNFIYWRARKDLALTKWETCRSLNSYVRKSN